MFRAKNLKMFKENKIIKSALKINGLLYRVFQYVHNILYFSLQV